MKVVDDKMKHILKAESVELIRQRMTTDEILLGQIKNSRTKKSVKLLGPRVLSIIQRFDLPTFLCHTFIIVQNGALLSLRPSVSDLEACF